MVNFNLARFRLKFKEGLYTDGFKLIEAWWDYDKNSVQIADDYGCGHSSVYPICFEMLCGHWEFVGDL